MIEPVSLLITALDKGAARLSARAFEAAVRAEKEPEREVAPQEQLLRSVQVGEATEGTPGVKDAIESGLITVDGGEELNLTPLGEYLLPPEDKEGNVSVEDKSRSTEPRPTAAA